jgi:hypothetical protein
VRAKADCIVPKVTVAAAVKTAVVNRVIFCIVKIQLRNAWSVSYALTS